MARPAPSSRRFAGSLLLSGALHAAMLVAMATSALSTARLAQWSLYEIDIEREPLRATPAPAPPATPEPAPAPVAGGADTAEGIPAGVPNGDPGGVPVPFPVGPGARVGDRPAPAAAQAGRVLTAEGEGVADFTIVQGGAERYAGGVSTATGTSKIAVRDPRARGAGVIPRHAARAGVATPRTKPATPTPTPPPLAPSRAAPALPASKSWSCPFPDEANANHVNYARVLIAVTVDRDGRARNVVVLSDPGNGFGRAARSCAYMQRFVARRGPDGQPVTGTTAPFHVTFTR